MRCVAIMLLALSGVAMTATANAVVRDAEATPHVGVSANSERPSVGTDFPLAAAAEGVKASLLDARLYAQRAVNNRAALEKLEGACAI